MRDGFVALDEFWSIVDCIPTDTNIITHNDIVKADSSFMANPFVSVDFGNNKLEDSVSTNQFKRPVNVGEKLIKIRTRSREIITSKNHRFFRMGRDPNYFNRHVNEPLPEPKEIFAKDIRKKDRILIVHKLTEPKEELMSPDMAQLLGYVMGDGTICYPHRWNLQADDSSLECLQEYGKIAKRLGFSTSFYKHKDANCHRIRFYKKEIIEKMLDSIKDSTETGKYTTKFKRIPEKIIKSNNKVVSSFLRGFFDAEGSIRLEKSLGSKCNYVRIRFAIKEKEIVEKVKYLLMRFGIETSNIHRKHDQELYIIEIKDTLSIDLFRKHIGFFHPKKKGILESNVIKRVTKRKIFDNIEIGFVTEVSEVDSPTKYLVDFTVPSYENYVANGFIVHNSRASTTKKNKIVSDILLKSRKRGLQYVFTAQILDLLDKRIRKVQDFTGYPYMNRTETATKLLIFRSGYPKEEHLLRTFYFKNPLVFDLYNTNEEILMEEKSDKEPLIVFQENFNEEHGYWCQCEECGTRFFDTWEEAEAYGLNYWNKNYKKLLPLIM